MSKRGSEMVADQSTVEYITVTIGEQLFGIPVTMVQDVFETKAITHVPMAIPEVAGVLNLRGRVLTAIDMRTRLRMPPREGDGPVMAVGIERNGEAYGLIIDVVGEVLRLKTGDLERNPSNLDPRWQQVANGVHRLEHDLLVVLDVERVLDFASSADVAA